MEVKQTETPNIHDKKALREQWGIEADKGCFRVIDVKEVVRRIETNNQSDLKAILKFKNEK